MAVTSIWPIKGRVGKVIEYARNPEKTTEEGRRELSALHAVGNVIEYAADEIKTERRVYVTGINCDERHAAEQFTRTKEFWGKTGGRMCYHGYQSFKADEVTAKTAHEIGVKLAQELWGDRFEVLVATHCNTGHYHNHLVVNSVSFMDGKKFYNSPADYARMREVSDRLCREYRLSVIEHPRNMAKSYTERVAEREGRPTVRGTIRADIDAAILVSITPKKFLRVLSDKGYTFKLTGEDGRPLKYPGLKPPGAKGYFRFHKLGAGYSLDDIRGRIMGKRTVADPYPQTERAEVKRLRAVSQPPYRRHVSGLRVLYLRYCYELNIIAKHPTSAKRVSLFMREELAKLDRLSAQADFLANNNIDTAEQLAAKRTDITKQMDALTLERQQLYGAIRCVSREGKDTAGLKRRRDETTAKLRQLRKDLRLCDGIAERSARTREELERYLDEQEPEAKKTMERSQER